ncbi:MAG: DUF342 domain-containing protein, partial [Firmicutes bacterium]|nr:DUF342 domain-containing protein [Bacillota bacterium]
MGAEENKFASEQKRLLMVKNNQVLLISGSDNSTPPTLSPGEGVRCYYYGEEKTEPFLVEDTSQLHIEIPAKTEEASIQVRIAADKMSAEVKVSPQKIIKCRLKDQSATSNLTLIIELEEIQEKPYFAKEDIMRKIKEEGVNYGFDEKILEVLAVRPDDRWYTVAKGKPPQAGRDGYVEILVEHEVKTVSYGQGLQKVDYRERINLPMVAEGDILARIHPPLEGEPGYNVIGEEIKPPPVKEAYYRCKKGAAVDTDDKGNLIIKATQKGRPLVEGKQKNIFSVSPLYHHAGDVDIKSGNLKFAGDLSISGNILEGMRVEAEGDLVVAGNTAGAEIFSGGNVIFHRNLINSRVQAGLKKAFYQEVFVLLKEFDELLEAVIAGLDQLRESMQSMGKDMPDKQIGKLIQFMVEKRYAKMPVVAAKISKLVKESRINVFTNLKESILGVVKYFTGYGFLDIKNQDHLLILSGNLRDAI